MVDGRAVEDGAGCVVGEAGEPAGADELDEPVELIEPAGPEPVAPQAARAKTITAMAGI